MALGTRGNAALRTGGAELFWTPLVSGADLLEVGRAEMSGVGDDEPILDRKAPL